VTQDQPASDTTWTRRKGTAPGPALVIARDSLPWRRRLGPLAWTTLQHLALSSYRTDQGWAVAVGVREIAAGVGVTKDTAARAVSVLVETGLVSRSRVRTPGGRRRSGYLLHLPSPIRLVGDDRQARGQPPSEASWDHPTRLGVALQDHAPAASSGWGQRP
jgi:hypothetical protein